MEWEATALLESFRPPLDDFRGFGSNVVFLGKGTVGVSELGAGLFGDRQGPGGEGSFLYLYLLGGGGGD